MIYNAVILIERFFSLFNRLVIILICAFFFGCSEEESDSTPEPERDVYGIWKFGDADIYLQISEEKFDTYTFNEIYSCYNKMEVDIVKYEDEDTLTVDLNGKSVEIQYLVEGSELSLTVVGQETSILASTDKDLSLLSPSCSANGVSGSVNVSITFLSYLNM